MLLTFAVTLTAPADGPDLKLNFVQRHEHEKSSAPSGLKWIVAIVPGFNC